VGHGLVTGLGGVGVSDRISCQQSVDGRMWLHTQRLPVASATMTKKGSTRLIESTLTGGPGTGVHFVYCLAVRKWKREYPRSPPTMIDEVTMAIPETHLDLGCAGRIDGFPLFLDA